MATPPEAMSVPQDLPRPKPCDLVEGVSQRSDVLVVPGAQRQPENSVRDALEGFNEWLQSNLRLGVFVANDNYRS